MTGAVDIHVHLFGACRALGNAWRPNGRLRRLARSRLLPFAFGQDTPDGEAADLAAAAAIVRQVQASRLHQAVLLALDAPHDEAGRPDASRLLVQVGNEFACQAARQDSSRLRFGASIHPYRPDALDQLAACVQRGAALVKWLPSYQNIRLEDPRCAAFYEALAHYGLPLLVHTGLEHTLSGGAQDLNHPRHLIHPLRRGVTVMAAHCGARLYLHEPCWSKAWTDLAERYDRCYGELSAFGSPVRLRILRRLLARPAWRAKLVYGSDFPARPVWAGLALPRGWRARADFGAPDNRLNQSLAVYEAAGVPTEVLNRGGALLPPFQKEKPCT